MAIMGWFSVRIQSLHYEAREGKIKHGICHVPWDNPDCQNSTCYLVPVNLRHSVETALELSHLEKDSVYEARFIGLAFCPEQTDGVE